MDILALPDRGLLHYGMFHLNLAAGLEDDLIRTINPEWNGGGTEDTAREKEEFILETPVIQDNNPTDSPPPKSFEITLHPTYYNQGFFNVGVAYSHLIGDDGQTIEVFTGQDEIPRLGAINRRANLNGTPRIMVGATLRDWFQHHAKLHDTVRVQVVSPTSIRLSVV